MSVIEECRTHSIAMLQAVDKQVASWLPEHSNLIVTGSYGRLEAHDQSDLDYFFLHDTEPSDTAKGEIDRRMMGVFDSLIREKPGDGGPWGRHRITNQLAVDIGGQSESNDSLTHRILFLFEGRAVGRNDQYRIGMTSLVQRYIGEAISDHQLGIFLLNDLIRFYRTMCVDFEHKTFEQGKPWGLNNIKLIFSRKLLYFSGVLVAAELYQRTPTEKRALCEKYFKLTPIERLQEITGNSCDSALRSYSTFLERLRDIHRRNELKLTTQDRNSQSENFRSIKNEGQHFTLHLVSLLQTKYPLSHPIHRALIA